MIWTYFLYFAVVAILFWVAGAAVAWKGKKSLATALTLVGLFVFLAYIIRMWLILERPPLRTMGETRLWYSSFLPLAGLIVYVRYRYRWILSLTTVVSIVFICINLFKPEIHSKTLMPALQSPLVCPSCHPLHVSLRPTGSCCSDSCLSVVFSEGKTSLSGID